MTFPSETSTDTTQDRVWARGTTPPSRMNRVHVELWADWERLKGMATTVRSLQTWSQAEEALSSFDHVDQLLCLTNRGEHRQGDQVVAALMRIHAGGDQLAGRVALQALLPKLTSMSRRLRTCRKTGVDPDDDDEGRLQLMVASFWEAISSYGPAQPTPITILRLSMDTLHVATRLSVAERRNGLATEVFVADPADLQDHRGASLCIEEDFSDSSDAALDIAAGARPDSSGATASSLLAWAVAGNVLDPETADLLWRYYGPTGNDGYLEHAHNRRAIAEDLGLTPVSLRRRCSRAVRLLAAAVRQDAEGSLVEPAP